MIEETPQRVKKQRDQAGLQKQPIPKPLVATAWKPGQSGNPAGRPLGARARVSEALIADIAEVWEVYGQNVLRRLAAQDPATLAKIAYGLLPRDVFISVEQKTPPGMDAADWDRMLALARTMREVAPDASIAQIEHALRSAFAKQIDSS